MDRSVVPARVGDDGPVVMITLAEELSPEHDVAISRVLSFNGFADSVGAIASSITQALHSAKPDEAQVDFGVDIGIEAGQLTSLIVQGSGTATMHIKLIWRAGNESEKT